jgi:hypothetical protein
MLRAAILQNLMQMPVTNFPVTSAYFTLDHLAGNRKNHLVEIKQQIRYKKETTYFKQLSEAERQSVLHDFDKITEFYSEGLDPAQAVSAICFASHGAGLWQTITLKRALKSNELVIQLKPYVRPLFTFFSTNPTYALILIDRTKARIFKSSLGEFSELFAVSDNAPESIKVGGFRGRQERRVERNIHEAVIQHYKQIAQKTFDYYKQYNFDWIILGGRRESINEFLRYLHTYPAQKIVGYLEIEPAAPLTEVLNKAQELEAQARATYEHKVLTELETKRQQGLVLEGIQAVLPKLLDGWLDALYIQENFTIKGTFCRQCNYLGLTANSACPVHGANLERTNDLIEHMLYLASQSGVGVKIIESDLTSQGNIIGILRFALGS